MKANKHIQVTEMNGGFVVSSGELVRNTGDSFYVTENQVCTSHRDVLDIIDNLLRPNGAADELPASAEDNKENV